MMLSDLIAVIVAVAVIYAPDTTSAFTAPIQFGVAARNENGSSFGRITNHLYSSASSSSPSASTTAQATSVDKVVVLEDADAVGNEIRQIVYDAAQTAIADRGHFALAIPGGSILKMLAGDDILSSNEWTSKTTIAYVNHKCVPMDDVELATHAKAMKIFMNKWNGVNPILMDGTSDGPSEAASYQQKLKSLSETVLPRDSSNGLPVFDLALIGVGDDGHIGSLYPNRDEVLVSDPDKWVLDVGMKSPPSITLTLPVMANAKQVVVAACGVSDKYPQGKSAGMYRAIASTEETIQSFPAVGLRPTATWVLDKAAASKLGDEYQ
jgi:6-phosphogluconolactonase